jgi:hypothetical protein
MRYFNLLKPTGWHWFLPGLYKNDEKLVPEDETGYKIKDVHRL